MSDTWTERLSEYIDGTLPASERMALEAHLRGCAACAATLDELRRVVARAEALDDRPPAADLWPAIAAQIGVSSGEHVVARLDERRRVRHLTFTVPQLAAAAILLAVLSGSAAWLLVRQRGLSPTTGAVTPLPPARLVSVASAADPRYAAAVADLERALQQGRGRLDTATVRVIEKNLAIIDEAIRDARGALAADPANAYLNLHLAEHMRRKLELLRRANALAGART